MYPLMVPVNNKCVISLVLVYRVIGIYIILIKQLNNSK